MADYKRHISLGFLWGIIYSSICFFTGRIDLIQGIMSTVLAQIGAALPDIDSDTARPRRIILGILGIAIPVIVASGYFRDVRLETTFCIILFSYVFVQYVLSYIFTKYTKHRGLFHSIPMVIFSSELTYLLFIGSGTKMALIYSIACGGGYLSHLVLDEFYSVNMMNLSLKRSFGTALSLKGDSTCCNLLLYLLILLSGLICCWKSAR